MGHSKSTAEAVSLPQLKLTQEKKLKQLSIVSVAQTCKVIPYSKLQSSLRIANIRELEDLVIDAMYLGMIEGKLDQKTMTLRVEKAMGRDLQPGQTQNVLAHLSSWLDTSASVLSAIDTQIQKIVVSDANYLSEKDIYDKELETAKATALKTLKSRTSFGDLDGGMDFQEVDSKPGATKRSTLKGTSSRRDRKY
ncbi:hypothetical protein HDU84_005973 [Entophlyctis sp. JEL0112]|nr:hypothetical protein HDU84_005973 [Entophlyctis sp. JEL0112]